MTRAGKKSERGFTLVECVIAAFIMAIAVVGGYCSFNSAFDSSKSGEIATLAGQLARAEIERAKVYGMTNLPLGTYSSSSQTATWTGSFDATYNINSGGWVAGETAWYDRNGTRLYSSTGAVLSTIATFTDSNVVPSSNSYTYQLASEKAMVVNVTQVSTGKTIFTTGTNIVTGGL